MILDRMGFSLLAITLDMILYITLHKLMGRKSDILLGLRTFGIKVMKVWFMISGILHEFRQERTALVT